MGSLLARYRDFLTSRNTIITLANAVLLLAGFVTGLAGADAAAKWLYLASALVGGAPIFYLAAGNIIRRFDLTAGVMVSIAMIAALVVGEYSAAALVAFMMLVGEMLEDMTVARADNALRTLEHLIPEHAAIRRAGQEMTVPVMSIKTGDTVVIRPGGVIPVDGVVVKGNAAVNQSSITGESLPLDAEPNTSVYAGSTCIDGALEITASGVGETTALGRMIALVKQARESQAPVQRVANKYAQFLTPIALGIAVITFFIFGDIMRAITVLIVICPCSLVLATPTALIAASGNSAKRGVVVKHGTAMETIGKVDVVVFDKTGTLTLGELSVAGTESMNSMSADDLLRLAAGAEYYSEHPLGRAIVMSAKQRGLEAAPARDFASQPGRGVSALVDDTEVTVGRRMISEKGIEVPDRVGHRITFWEESGQTVIPVAVGRTVEGLILISDTVRAESRQAISRILESGAKDTVLLSGDSESATRAAGDALGVTRSKGEVLPDEKLLFVRELQEDGRRVAFVGDGVNDAGALAAADVGIAMGSIGTSIAIESADIVLLNDRLSQIPELMQLSQTGLRTIRNNVLFAMSMNMLSVVLGIFGVIGPVVGAVMHEASALPVVANSARLIGWRPKKRNTDG